MSFLFLLIVTVGCNNSDKDALEKLNKEVLKVHDEVMPKMGEINRLKRHIRAYKDVVSDENGSLKDSLINTILLLSKSEDLMDDWMDRYDYPNDEVQTEKMKQYLTAQKDTIKLISDEIFMSLAIANGLMKNAPDSIKNLSK